jgi:hypothetical protein
MVSVWVIIGAVVLILGRRLYWLFIGGLGFLLGFALASRFIQDKTGWVALAIAIVCGVICALLVYYLQRLAVVLAGLIGGGYLTMLLMDTLKLNTGNQYWLAIVAGGIIGALLVSVLFDWVLILLSSIMGAVLVVRHISLPIDAQWMVLVFVTLLLFGVWVQSVTLPKKSYG